MLDEEYSIKDYIRIIYENIFPISIISIIILVLSIVYAINSIDIYSSTTLINLSKPKGDILQSPLLPEFNTWGNDRFIANEIEILKTYTIRKNVAETLIDTFTFANNNIDDYSIIFKRDSNYSNTFISRLFNHYNNNTEKLLKTIDEIAKSLENRVNVEQKRGLDIIEITSESPSSYEAKLIANTYADEYRKLNLYFNRQQLITVKEFLSAQREQKLADLVFAEENLQNYQEKGGIIQLDEQASALIEQLTSFESQLKANNIELTVTEKSLKKYKEELAEQDPRINDYLESLSTEPYLKNLQEKIAELQTQKDLALANSQQNKISSLIQEYDNRINELQSRVDEKLNVYKAGIFASSPEEIKQLTQKVLEETVKYQSLLSSSKELEEIVSDYEKKFNELPKRSIDLARLQREKSAYEKLYLLVEEKYQEALINEQSTPGNVQIVDKARISELPSKPNRKLIVLIGLFLGLSAGIAFAFIKNYFNNKIKTPEDIKNLGVEVVGWIPQMNVSDSEFIFAEQPNSIPSESFRSLRTRIQFTIKNNKKIKKILITSSKAQEGKTTIASNLAGSFALANKKTVVLDCDLRKPRIHKIFNEKRIPGFTDFFFGETTFDSIIRKSKDIDNLFHITAGTIPPNPSEIISSDQMKEFLEKLSNEYDYIIVDSPPSIAVTDAEIISRLVDVTILVSSAEVTEKDLLQKSVELLGNENFMGVLLNNFSYKKSGYGSYYKYYYYYSHPTNGDAKQRKKKKRSKSLA
jgi:tyrosine-protein kinase Etk/Wzc